jgi:hypothetical protein
MEVAVAAAAVAVAAVAAVVGLASACSRTKHLFFIIRIVHVR